MKKTFKERINTINYLAKNAPKTINEAVDYGEDIPEYQDDYEEDNYPQDENIPREVPQEENTPSEPVKDEKSNISSSAEETLNQIRKMALSVMSNLADTPEDPDYQTMKKIFTMLDKAVTDKMDQREVMAKNPNANQ